MTSAILFVDLDSLPADQLAVIATKLSSSSQLLIVPVTHKTRAEVEALLPLTLPFIVETGSGIFIPANQGFTNVGEPEDGYRLVQLGCPHVQARAGLRVLANLVQYPLQGFGDLSAEKAQLLLGLSAAAAHRAKAREFSEAFFTPQGVTAEALAAAAEEIGLRMVIGDRVSYLIGPDAGIAPAIRQFIALYPPKQPMTTLGLSENPELLATVETPILPSQSGDSDIGSNSFIMEAVKSVIS
ncbi:haloacid dehalogenase [Romeria aff. gracilis LEGE 07310]|uniref:Haloacid dehalogenase n=1 Tax=Vasconcelosia minhoensis LEGE 07310 TaxID=915328 RepID=A0A8J7DRU2_9CYAN|nr:haloacid dehalogenase [Romeria gracilis]MBE9079324.1 haloacid dehalogenase [Romeria aff. gracilis LEGE 07310]